MDWVLRRVTMPFFWQSRRLALTPKVGHKRSVAQRLVPVLQRVAARPTLEPASADLVPQAMQAYAFRQRSDFSLVVMLLRLLVERYRAMGDSRDLGVAHDVAHACTVAARGCGLVVALAKLGRAALVPDGRVCVAAVPGMQVLDITHVAQFIMEKAMDRRSCGGMAQADSSQASNPAADMGEATSSPAHRHLVLGEGEATCADTPGESESNSEAKIPP